MKQKLRCIMLIDDDEPTNFLSRVIVEVNGCANHIQIEDSGERAIDYLMASKVNGSENNSHPWPDLLFLDINMPAMNGWEFLDKYKNIENPYLNNPVIIMLTTSLDPNDIILAGANSEVSGFEFKPFTSELLERVLNKYFNPNLKPLT